MKYKLNIKNNLVTSFEVGGETYTLKTSLSPTVLEGLIATQSTVYLEDNSLYCFKGAGGTAENNPALLSYIIENNRLTQGTELTTAVPTTAGSKGFLTGTAQTALIDFYKSFGYNELNYKLMIGDPRIEISFLCSDRRSGVAGSRRAWSPYFKISDLEKTTFTLIQNELTGTDQTAGYNIQAKITRNAAGSLFITLTDTHAGTNLFGSVINIRHRVGEKWNLKNLEKH